MLFATPASAISSYVHSEPGHGHQNEDVVIARPHPEDERVFVCSLADGQGGQPGGGEAARLAAERSVEVALSHSVKTLQNTTVWYDIVGAADEAGADHEDAGFTTLVSLCVTERSVCGASCGDSGALLVQSGGSVVLTQKQRKNPPVGSGAAVPVAFSARLKLPWMLLVMSDGVWKFIGWDTIIELTARKRGEELIAALRHASLQANGGKFWDDFSLILLQQEEA